MKDKLVRFFTFVRLLDEQNNISLTNIAVILMLIKIGTAKALGMNDIGIAIIALLNYSHKRQTNK